MNLNDILREGEKLYLERFKDELEADHQGEYAVIDVESGDFVVDGSKVAAIDKAQEKFGTKLFYIVQVGGFDSPTHNYRSHQHASWIF